MNVRKKSGIITLMAAALLFAVIFAPSMSANENKTKSEKALEYVSQKHGILKERLIVTNEKESNFSLSNQKIWSINILDPKGKKFYYVDIDEEGNIADIKAAKAQEYAKYIEKYGKKEIALHEKLQKMNPDDTVEVSIWLSPLVTPPFPEREITEQEYKGILDANRKAYAEKEKPVLEILKAKNINIRYASQYAPLIYAQVPVKLMAEVENIPEVDGIYLAREFRPMLDKVAQTVRVEPVWNAGINGSGIKVALVEQGKIMFPHPNLTQGSVYNASEANDSHATMVAGIIATINNDTYRGISKGVPGLLSANYGRWNNSDPLMESRIIGASDWAINESANILTNSWGNATNGTMSGIDKYFDLVVREKRKTVTVAAGNYYTGESRHIQSPGLGYNIITVGGFEDKGDSDWSNDVIWNDSNYIDPSSPYGDREKPEVASVAIHKTNPNTTYITTLDIAEPWISDDTQAGGTSFATPAVAAEAALLMQADNSLKTKPEVIKAIIMASAVHNIEGDSRLSDKDGAGGIDISNAYETRTAASSMNASAYPQHFNFSATAGQKIRVVIAWDSHPDNNSPPVSDELQSDLNLVVYSPSDAVVGSPSSSFDNSYEIVEFTATETGTYDAQVQARTYSGSEIIGFAKTVVALPGWDYRKQKNITGTTAGAQTNYQMKLTVYKGSGTDTPGVVYLGGNVRDDFGDLRFTKSDGVTLLDYWIESYTLGVSAIVWVEIDYIPASPNNVNIYLYYGNPSATSAGSGAATFVLFEDFESGTINPAKWVQHNSNYPATISTEWASSGTYSLKVVRPTPTWLDSGIRTSMSITNVRAIVDARITAVSGGVLGTVINTPTQEIGAGVKNAIGTYINWESDPISVALPYSITFRTGLTSRSSDGVTGYFDRIRIRKYVSPEPTWAS